MQKELAKKLRVRQIIRTSWIKFSNIPPYKSAEIYFDNKGNIVEALNYQRIPSHELRVEVCDWKKFIYDNEENLIQVIDLQQNIEMDVTAEERGKINMKRYYINYHSGYVYSIFGNHINSKRFVELKTDNSINCNHPALTLSNETVDTFGQSSPYIRPSDLDDDATEIEKYERQNLPPKDVLIIDDANVIEYKYDYIFY